MDWLNTRQTNSNDALYMLSLGIYILYCGLLTSFYAIYISNDALYKAIVVICMTLLVIKELSAHLNSKTIIVIGFFLIISLLVLKNGEGLGQKSLFFSIIYIICARDISIRKIYSLSAIIIAFLLIVVVISSRLGLISNFTNVRGDGTFRNPLGFRWVLFAPTFYFEFVCLLVLLKRKEMNVVILLLLGLIGWWFYKETDSRMCFVMTIAVILFALADKCRSCLGIKVSTIVRIAFGALVISYVFFFIFGLVITVKYNPDNELFSKLNNMLSDRLHLGQSSIEKYGVSMFGTRGIEWTGHGRDMYGNELLLDYNYVDCGYIVLLQRYGIVFSLFWILINSITIAKAFKIGDYYLVTVMALIAAHLLIDDLQLSLHYNVFWLANSILLNDAPKKGEDSA